MNEAYGPVLDEVRVTSLLSSYVEWTMVDRDGVVFGQNYYSDITDPPRVIAYPWKPYDELEKDFLERSRKWREQIREAETNLTEEGLLKLATEQHAQKVKEIEESRSRGYFHSGGPSLAELHAQIESGWKSHLSILHAQEPKAPVVHRGVVVSVLETALHVRDLLTGRLWLVPLEACRQGTMVVG